MPWDGRRWGWHLRTRRGCGGIRLPVFPLPAAAATVATAAARSRALQFFYFIKVAKKFLNGLERSCLLIFPRQSAF